MYDGFKQMICEKSLRGGGSTAVRGGGKSRGCAISQAGSRQLAVRRPLFNLVAEAAGVGPPAGAGIPLPMHPPYDKLELLAAGGTSEDYATQDTPASSAAHVIDVSFISFLAELLKPARCSPGPLLHAELPHEASPPLRRAWPCLS